MTLAKEMTKCPFCKEPIIAGALRCKHCHAELGSLKAKRKNPLARLNTFRTGFLTGVLFTLILAILAYIQFYGK